VAVLGFFGVTLDALVVNVALPAIGSDLGGGITGLQWVVDGYTLMFAALLMSAGALSDRIGARQAYRVGLVTFVAASAACGLAPTMGVLVAARLAQGAGAAVIMPASLALIREAYQDARKRAGAIAIWSLGGAVASAAGPVVGGFAAGEQRASRARRYSKRGAQHLPAARRRAGRRGLRRPGRTSRDLRAGSPGQPCDRRAAAGRDGTGQLATKTEGGARMTAWTRDELDRIGAAHELSATATWKSRPSGSAAWA
jgi:hypothetical protein